MQNLQMRVIDNYSCSRLRLWIISAVQSVYVTLPVSYFFVYDVNNFQWYEMWEGTHLCWTQVTLGLKAMKTFKKSYRASKWQLESLKSSFIFSEMLLAVIHKSNCPVHMKNSNVVI